LDVGYKFIALAVQGDLFRSEGRFFDSVLKALFTYAIFEEAKTRVDRHSEVNPG
jgi:hypothetical protein